MMPQMPQMPSMDKSSDAGEINSPASSSPLTEDSVGKAAESDVEFKKPILNSVDKDVHSQVVIPSAPKRGIEVVATRKGFYNQRRIKEGDKFFIKSEEQFGDWMKCVEPYYEKIRLEFYKNKKAKK